jgi:hypothetical protein
MNFKLKALVAATVATITMSGAANALTNNEIFLVAYDSVNLKTFVAALGGAGTTASFDGTSNLSFNYGSDANWASFISTASTGSIAYQVLGFNSTGGGGVGAADKLLVSTNAMPTGNLLTNTQMTNLMNDVTTPGSTIWFWESQTLGSLTGTGTAFVSGTGDGSGAIANTNVFNKVINLADTTAALGTNLNFWSVTRPASTSNPTQQIKTQFKQGATATADFWNLAANGTLTYTGAAATAPVPEADTWAMMLLGLGFMGFVARRRQA